MKIRQPNWRSLKTRVIIMALAIFVLSILALSFLTSQILRRDLEHLVGEQQFSAATIVAAEIEQEIGDRLRALELVAGQIKPGHMAAPAKLQNLFAVNPLLMSMFNGGAFVTNADATTIASVPEELGRVGINYRERDHISAALQQGIPSVSEAVVGKMLNEPVVSLAVPIRDERQAVVGVMVGVINLGQSNFLDFIIGHKYGITGGYMLVDPKHRQIVTATDKRFNLKPLPPPGTDTLTDQYAQGFQGHGILVDALGVENVSAAHTIATAGWVAVALFPTAEAFAPIASIQWKTFYIALVLTIVAGGLTWWILRRELTPVIDTALTLARLSRSNIFPAALPVTRHDEVGDLIGGFNRLLEFLHQRESALIDSEQRARAMVERLRQLSRATEQSPIAVVITDLKGAVEYVNPQFEVVTGYALHEVLGRNPRILQSGQTPVQVYADLWQTLQAGDTWRGEFYNRKKSGELFIEHAVIAPILDGMGAVTHYVALKEDITEQKQREGELQSSLKEKTALLNEVHHRVKNNLQVITSLLRLESGRASEAATRSVLEEMKGRIRSMALVHETLYRSGNFAGVELHRYIGQVVTVAFRAQASTGGKVRLVLDLASVTASLDLATPCGLLVNELISNCVKHGFVHGESGEVRVALQPADSPAAGPARWCLRVSDTGVGLPADFEARRGQSLGLQLAADLAGQIGGALIIEPGPGAAFSVTFPVEAT